MFAEDTTQSSESCDWHFSELEDGNLVSRYDGFGSQETVHSASASDKDYVPPLGQDNNSPSSQNSTLNFGDFVRQILMAKNMSKSYSEYVAKFAWHPQTQRYMERVICRWQLHYLQENKDMLEFSVASIIDFLDDCFL